MDPTPDGPRALEPEDWRALRLLRLDALRDAPDAFGGTYEDEVRRDESGWQWWIVGEPGRSVVRTFAFERDGALVGMSTGAEFTEEPGTMHLFGMWVRPAHRGRGLGTWLVGAVTERAIARGADHVILRVSESNAGARRLYERCGFRLRPEDRSPLRDGSEVMTVGMERSLLPPGSR